MVFESTWIPTCLAQRKRLPLGAFLLPPPAYASNAGAERLAALRSLLWAAFVSRLPIHLRSRAVLSGTCATLPRSFGEAVFGGARVALPAPLKASCRRPMNWCTPKTGLRVQLSYPSENRIQIRAPLATLCAGCRKIGRRFLASPSLARSCAFLLFEAFVVVTFYRLAHPPQLKPAHLLEPWNLVCPLLPPLNLQT